MPVVLFMQTFFQLGCVMIWHALSKSKHPLLFQKPCPRRWSAIAAGWVALGRKEYVCWSPIHGREFAKTVHAIGRSSTASAHVHDSAALWLQLLFCEYQRSQSLLHHLQSLHFFYLPLVSFNWLCDWLHKIILVVKRPMIIGNYFMIILSIATFNREVNC